MDPFVNKNLRTESKIALKQANKAWSDCVAANFLPLWLQGQDVKITEVCTEELARMNELDTENYGTLPFKLPQA